MPDNPATVTLQIIPPGETEPQNIEINLMGFTLAERNLAKKAMQQFTDPDILEIQAVNAWVVWKRTHPECSLDLWVNTVTFGDMLGPDWQSVLDQAFVTPDGYDPEA